MKKLWKKLLAVTTAVMMAITLLPAMANAETEVNPNAYKAEDNFVVKPGRIKIHKTTQDANKPLAGAGFTVYTALTFKEENGKIVVDENYTGTAITDVNTADFKTIVGTFANSEAVKAKYGNYIAKTEDFTNKDGNIEFDNLPAGIYVVAETTVPTSGDATYYESIPFIVSLPSTAGVDANGNTIGDTTEVGKKWIYDITATPKNNSAHGEKRITGVTNGNKTTGAVDKNGNATANIGDTVSYEIKATSPTKEANQFNISDEISGLSINKDSIKVSVGGTEIKAGNNTYELKDITNGFEVAFKKEWINSYPNTEVVITYNAIVLDTAKIGTDANTNKAIIDFGHDSKHETNIPKVFTYGFILTKQGEGSEKLQGVKFELYKEDKTTKIKDLETDEDGLVKVDGLAAGIYYLKEVKTNSGYTLLANPIKIEIVAPTGTAAASAVIKKDDGTSEAIGEEDENGNARFAITVINKKGFNLPSTGGMGTYLFTIAGLVIMAGAAFLLIASKKRRA